MLNALNVNVLLHRPLRSPACQFTNHRSATCADVLQKQLWGWPSPSETMLLCLVDAVDVCLGGLRAAVTRA